MSRSRRTAQKLTHVVSTLLLMLFASQAEAQHQQFRLSVPGEIGPGSTAVVTPQGLVITDAEGNSFRYTRTPRFDTPDGGYLGFYNQATQQSLRWPATGQGSMRIGDRQGLAWRASQQQVQPMAAAGGPVIQPRVGVPGAGGPMIVPGAATGPQLGQVHPHGLPGVYGGSVTNVAVGVDRRGVPQMALVDSTGVVRVYSGAGGGWQYSTEMTGLDLVPGAPLGLTPDIVPGLPRVFTVTAGGSLVMLTRDQGPVPVAPQIAFPPAAPLSMHVDARRSQSFAVDVTGRLWELDLTRQAHRLIDNTAGQFVPGSRVSVLTRPGPQGTLAQTVLLTDARRRAGTVSVGCGWLVAATRSRQWLRPRRTRWGRVPRPA